MCEFPQGPLQGQRPWAVTDPFLAWALPGSSCGRGDLRTAGMWGNNNRMSAGSYWCLLWTSRNQIFSSLWRESLGFFLKGEEPLKVFFSRWENRICDPSKNICDFFFCSLFFEDDFCCLLFLVGCGKTLGHPTFKYPSLAVRKRGGYSKVMSGETSVLSCCEAGCSIHVIDRWFFPKQFAALLGFWMHPRYVRPGVGGCLLLFGPLLSPPFICVPFICLQAWLRFLLPLFPLLFLLCPFFSSVVAEVAEVFITFTPNFL